jgi:hypothetical protein
MIGYYEVPDGSVPALEDPASRRAPAEGGAASAIVDHLYRRPR